MRKSLSGFTIVELLIVIVVIAVLATISVAAYNGLQQRANNAKTVSAVTAYVKALQMYKVDNGQYPPVSSCLGSMACDSGMSYIENGGGLNTTYLANYFSSTPPTPATNSSSLNAGRQLGGAVYVWNNTAYGGNDNGGIGLYYQVDDTCPALGGLTLIGFAYYDDHAAGRWCRYALY